MTLFGCGLFELMDGNSENPSPLHNTLPTYTFVSYSNAVADGVIKGGGRSCTPPRVFACRVTLWNLLYGFFLVLT